MFKNYNNDDKNNTTLLLKLNKTDLTLKLIYLKCKLTKRRHNVYEKTHKYRLYLKKKLMIVYSFNIE